MDAAEILSFLQCGNGVFDLLFAVAILHSLGGIVLAHNRISGETAADGGSGQSGSVLVIFLQNHLSLLQCGVVITVSNVSGSQDSPGFQIVGIQIQGKFIGVPCLVSSPSLPTGPWCLSNLFTEPKEMPNNSF